MSSRAPVRESEVEPARRRTREPRAAEERRQSRACAEPEAQSFRFDDPYWDEVFDSYYNPTLRTCCRG
jgi:hypothetical protein